MTKKSTNYEISFKSFLLGFQILCVAFGALVLVPILTGLNPNVALLTAGIGTLIFQFITKGKVPIFLGSSFAFIAPIIYGIQNWGLAATLSGLFAAGIVYMIFSLIIRVRGVVFFQKLFPPEVTGPVIMVIGLILAPIGVNMALGKTGDGAAVLLNYDKAIFISMLTLVVTCTLFIFGRGMLQLIPILGGIAAGYILSVFMGVVDFTAITQASWFSLPDFTTPVWHWEAIILMSFVAIAPAIEHFGDILAIGNVTGKDFMKDPGLDKTMLGDGIATSVAASLGGPPNTTYSEVTGAVAMLKTFNPAIMTFGAIIAIFLAFIGKLGAFLQTIPTPVMGGILLLVFGAITVVGLKTLIQAGERIMQPRNIVIISLMIVFGIGGMFFNLGELTLKGIALSALTGVILNQILPQVKEE